MADSDPKAHIPIVGGGPPKEERAFPEVPQGMQNLLLMASEDPRLKAALLDNRASTLERCGVLLTENERRILLSIPHSQLEQMMRHVRAPQLERRRFLSQAAGSVVALLAGTLLPGCGSSNRPPESPTPEPPPLASPSTMPSPSPLPVARPPVNISPPPYRPSRGGIRPDRPE